MSKFFSYIFILFGLFDFSTSFKTIIYPLKKSNIQNIKMSYDMCPEYLEKFSNIISQDQGEFMIKRISSIFPQIDSISHFVLHTNDVLINNILNNDNMKMETKKMLVIMLVEMTQSGDATGGYILNFYHDLVNCLL